MANPFYGEADAEIDGRKLRLVFNFSALAAMETRSDRSFQAIAKELSPNEDGSPKDNLKISTAALLLWGCLRAKHSSVSFDEAGEMLLGEDGGAITEALLECLGRAFPDAVESKNPQKRRGASKAS